MRGLFYQKLRDCAATSAPCARFGVDVHPRRSLFAHHPLRHLRVQCQSPADHASWVCSRRAIAAAATALGLEAHARQQTLREQGTATSAVKSIALRTCGAMQSSITMLEFSLGAEQTAHSRADRVLVLNATSAIAARLFLPPVEESDRRRRGRSLESTRGLLSSPLADPNPSAQFPVPSARQAEPGVTSHAQRAAEHLEAVTTRAHSPFRRTPGKFLLDAPGHQARRGTRRWTDRRPRRGSAHGEKPGIARKRAVWRNRERRPARCTSSGSHIGLAV